MIIRAKHLLHHVTFWGEQDMIDITGTPTNCSFAQLVISDIPASATISRAYLLWKYRQVVNDSVATNYINTAGKFRIMPVLGNIGTDDVIGLNVDGGKVHVSASATGAGDVICGSVNLKTFIATNMNGTYQLLMNQTVRGDAPAALANTLHFHDSQLGLEVYYLV